MLELISAIGLVLLGGVTALAFRSRAGLSQSAGQSGAIAGSVLGLMTAVRVLVAGDRETLILPWLMPGGGLHFQVDALSAFFLLPVFGLSLAAAIYGRSYLEGQTDT